MNSELADIYTDAERAYASCVLAHGTPEVVHAIRPEQIADPTSRAIVETAAKLLDEGMPPDPLTVGHHLAFARNDWPLRVFEVYEHRGAVWVNWRTYAALVSEGHELRQATATAQRVIQAAASGDVAAVRAALDSVREVVQ